MGDTTNTLAALDSIGQNAIALGNYKTNKEIAAANLAFQKENYDYQKALQQKLFEREDTAYQRQIADMKAAGLNPYGASGGANAGSVVSTTAPQNKFNSNLQLGSMTDAVLAMESIKQARLNTDIAKATSLKAKNEAEIYARDNFLGEINAMLNAGYQIDQVDPSKRFYTVDSFYKPDFFKSNQKLEFDLAREMLTTDKELYSSSKWVKMLATILQTIK